jgi:hypothetical protein
MLISRRRGSSRAVLNNPETIGCYLPFFASVWSRSASAMPANTPLASIATRALAPRTVKLPHCIGEEFSGLGTAHEGSAGRPAKDGTDNVPDGLGIDPALLQNLARQLFDAFSDRLVFDCGRRGVCRRCGRIRHVMLLGCCWSIAYRILRGADRRRYVR